MEEEVVDAEYSDIIIGELSDEIDKLWQFWISCDFF
jgi:hypothetical protein